MISDIHNDLINFRKMLKKIKFTEKDILYILGDVFDKGYRPMPVELYFEILKYENVYVIRGNHDNWLSQSIKAAVRNKKDEAYSDSYYLIRERLVEMDMLNLADWIDSMPLQVAVEVEGVKYLLAHAQTEAPVYPKDEEYFLMGDFDKNFYQNGIPGFVSVIGHITTDFLRIWLNEKQKYPCEIWKNKQGNVYSIDCGNGIRKANADCCRLACMRLNDRKYYYV